MCACLRVRVCLVGVSYCIGWVGWGGGGRKDGPLVDERARQLLLHVEAGPAGWIVEAHVLELL